MAERSCSKRKDTWSCPICLDVFIRPRSLPCLHTFCTSCLQSHIMNAVNQSLLSQFNCPVCRAQAKPPKSFKARETWAEQFPINHWLVSMMDEEEFADDIDLQVEERKNCCEVHTDMTIRLFCVDHEALCCPMCVATDHRRCDEVREITEILEEWDVAKETDDVTRTLVVTTNYVDELKKARQEHALVVIENKSTIIRKITDAKQKLVKHFDKLEITLIESVDTKYSEINTDIQDDLKKCRDTEKTVDDSKKLIAKIMFDPSAKVDAFIIVSQVQAKCRNMVETICKTKITVQDESIDCQINKNILNIENIVPSFGEIDSSSEAGNVHEEGAQLDKDLDTTLTRSETLSLESTAAATYLDLCGDDGDGSFEIVNTADVESKTVWYTYDTEERLPRVSVLSNETATSENTVNENHFQLSPNSHLQLVKVQIVLTTVDENPCWITSACIIQNNCMIVCDRKNTKVKLFKAGRLVCEDQKSTSPWCVSRLTDTLVAITYPQESLVRIFDLRLSEFFIKLTSTFPMLGSVMKLERSFPVCVPCFGITCLRGVLIITCEDCLKVYSAKGKLLQIVSKDSSDQALFTRATFIAADDNRSICFVTDEGKNSVTSFGMTFKTLIPLPRFVYTNDDLKCPQGLAVGISGDVYVCGFGSMNIHQISKDGHLRRIITTTIRPWNVAASPNRRMLCFSCYPESEQCKCIYFYEHSGS